jgi:serine/threonine protein kinase
VFSACVVFPPFLSPAALYPSIAHLLDPSKPRGQLEVVAVDFGCCQEVGEMCLQEPHVTGTPLYMAPEDLRGCHGLEVDIWAAGVMVSQQQVAAKS